MEVEAYYLAADTDMVVAAFQDEVRFVRNNWTLEGRPTMCILLSDRHFRSPRSVGSRQLAPHPALLARPPASPLVPHCSHGAARALVGASWLRHALVG